MSVANSHIDLYESRYQEGYMESWDESKKNKIIEIFKSLDLPEQGNLLDFGSGNGVFTILLKKILPKWNIYGFEISTTALRNAKEAFPNCTFFGEEELESYTQNFDFIFSHHVLEHVQDLEESLQTINNLLKENASQLHILPCGNEGSFEYEICIKKINGIEINKNNRFFFEEPGHLRRVTSSEFSALENKFNFKLEKEFYSNQYWGAINWITKSSPRFVLKLTNSAHAINNTMASELAKFRKYLLPLTLLQFPYSKFLALALQRKKHNTYFIKKVFLFLPAMISKIMYLHLEKKSIAEWKEKKYDKKGSEMFLYFIR